MRKIVVTCTLALALAGCAGPEPHYAYPPAYEAPMAPPQPRSAPPPAYQAPTPAPRTVRPLNQGLLTAKNVGGYIDGEEHELRVALRGSGVGVSRPGDAVTLFLRDDVIFHGDGESLTPRGQQILSAIAALSEKYDSTFLTVNGYLDMSVAPDRAGPESQARADAVAHALEADGVDGHRIAAHGLGTAHPRIVTGQGVREPRNRRVEILITPRMKG